ncbi:unnamed protein product [Phytomonas sp. EM1]|nr:unnamed protein product [Phytomonas sp. EM1]|eukprot:CCW63413.1 unnamed protein product [Phytomonas sp. isolate EM1]
MSLALFEFLNRASEDPNLPSMVAIPPADFLLEQAWKEPYVFRFISPPSPPTATVQRNRERGAKNSSSSTTMATDFGRRGSIAAGSNPEQQLILQPGSKSMAARPCSGSPCPSFHNLSRGGAPAGGRCILNPQSPFLPALTEQGWPTTLRQLRLYEVGCATLWKPAPVQPSTAQEAAGRQPYREAVHMTRWEIPSTVLALERYQLISIPYTKPDPAPAFIDAAGDTTLNLLMLLGCKTNESEHGGAREDDNRAETCQVLRPGQLTAVEQRGAKVVATLCRVISTSGGIPPTPAVSTENLLGIFEGVLRHTFFYSSLPLLGVNPDWRLESWQKTLLMDVCEASHSHGGLTTGNNSYSDDLPPLCVEGNTQEVELQDPLMTAVIEPWGAPANLSTTTLQENGNEKASSSTVPVPVARSSGQREEEWLVAAPRTEPRRPVGLSSSSNLTQWRHTALRRMLRNDVYGPEVKGGWRIWTRACKEGLSRPLIINSIDEIVNFCGCSRNAFYTAVAYLDRFVALATDPVASCRNFLESVFQGGSGGGGGGGGGGGASAASLSTFNIDYQTLCTYLTQVIAACAMLGCKFVETYPPRVNKVLMCLQAESRLSQEDFWMLEIHVLSTLRYRLQPVTVSELVETLLCFGGGDGLERECSVEYYTQLLHGRARSEPHLAPQVYKRILQHRECASRYASAEGVAAEDPRASQPASTSGAGSNRSKWQQLCMLARFICDMMIRGSPSANSSRGGNATHGGVESSVSCFLDIPPSLLAVAIVVVTAEVLRTPLPEPLFALLPPSYQAQLQRYGLGAATRPFSARTEEAGATLSRSPSASDAAAADHTTPSNGELENGKLPQGQPSSSSIGVAAQEEEHTLSSSICLFPVSIHDDTYALLQTYCEMVKSMPYSNFSKSSPLAPETDGGRYRGQYQNMLMLAIEEVHRCYRECRETPCDPILRKRYRDMFSTQVK